MREIKILVIGDSCLDIYKYGHIDRMCPEAPVPVFVEDELVENFGMAYNVYNNITSFKNVEAKIITNNPDNITKTRFVDKKTNQMIMRLDNDGNGEVLDVGNILGIIKHYDAVVISDYNKGFLTYDNIHKIASFCSSHNILSFLDTKKNLTDSLIENVSYIKINEKEFAENYHGTKIHNNVIVTMGNKGCRVMGEDNIIIQDNPHETIDVSGAGDSFLASFVINYIRTKSVENSLKKANSDAAYVVKHKGIAQIKKEI